MGGTKANIQCLIISTTKQATSITLATTVGYLLDHIVRTFIRDAIVQKQDALATLFDLEKAYDTTWTHCILSDLWDFGFRGHPPIFMDGFLSDRLLKSG